ncbi:MAG: diguanylate cyclase [Pseudomonadota bacterium]
MVASQIAIRTEKRPVHLSKMPHTNMENILPQALVLEDDSFDSAVICELLTKFCSKKFDVTTTTSLQETVRYLSRREYDVVLADMNVVDSQGLDTIKGVIRSNPDVPVVVLTGNDNIELATAALRAGAHDYLPKSQLDNQSLQRVIEFSIERRNKESHIKTKSFQDSLTGLSNRSHLYARWRRSVMRAQRDDLFLGVFVIKVEGLDEINSRYGHEAGHQVIADVATFLKSSVRESDIISRLTNDEFIVVLENIKSVQDVSLLKTSLTERHRHEIKLDDCKVAYRINVGGSLSDPSDQEDLMGVLQRVDLDLTI